MHELVVVCAFSFRSVFHGHFTGKVKEAVLGSARQNILPKHSWAEPLTVLCNSQILKVKVPGVGTGVNGILPSPSVPPPPQCSLLTVFKKASEVWLQVSVALEKILRSETSGVKKAERTK